MKEKLKRLRREMGVSQSEVAKVLGISASAYANYEQGIREPSLQIFSKLCDYFQVSANYLLGRSENWPSV